MFWDRAAIFYDLFGYIYNGDVNERLCAAVSELLGGGVLCLNAPAERA